MGEILDSDEQAYCIICGNFNIALDPAIDTNNYLHVNNPNARNAVIDLMSNFNLIDGFRMFHKNTRRYTWRRKNPLRQSRLDYFLISDPLLDLVNSCEIRPGYRTDHSIVELTLTLCKFKRGKGIWKFNCSMLKQKEYLSVVNSLIEKEKEICAIPVYRIENISHISDSDIQFIINDG